MRESSVAGRAKRNKRVIELTNGGRVLPIPWKTLDEVKTIPMATKFSEMILRYSLPKAITPVSLEKSRMKVSPANCEAIVSRSIVTDVIPSAE